ncbi:MAG TPA: hypothetical protein EYP59_12510 [Thiotrichaceae bacterium]|nr:hypothetical protein [Thiotrichaceae bacterium]
MDILSAIVYEYRDYRIVFYGIFVTIGVLWQWYLLTETDPKRQGYANRMLPRFIAKVVPNIIPRRAVIPYVFGIFIIIGTVVHSSFELADSYGIYFNEEMLSAKRGWWINFFKATLLGVIIVAKAWLGPALLSFSLVYVVHQLSRAPTTLSDATLEWLPILQDLLDSIFKSLPDNIYVIYSFIILIYIAVTSLHDLAGAQEANY